MSCTVEELLSRLTARELCEWRIYYSLEPFGEERADLRAGIIAATIANCHSEKAKFKPIDFMPFRERKPQTWEDMKRVLGGIVGIHSEPSGNPEREP